MSRKRPRSIHSYAARVAAGVIAVLVAGAAVILGLLAASPEGVPLAQAALVLGLLIAVTAALLSWIFIRTRRRLIGELNALVRIVERSDPEAGTSGAAPAFEIEEFSRLYRAFIAFFARFTASRARQEQAEETLGYILRHAADAILVLDRDGKVLSWNRGAEETLGFSAEEMEGAPYARLAPGGELEPELRVALAPGERVGDLRTQRRRRDGRMIDVSLTRSRVPVPSGGEDRFVEILRDISATRRLEDDLLRSEKMAAVGKISSKVVHEIRNPLASINLNVDLLLESQAAAPAAVDPEAREILGAIKREIRRLSHITEEYLQFSRLPRAAFQRERVNDLLVELSDFVRPLIGRKGVRLTLNLDEEDPEAVCDATLLRQALLNLLRNAVDAVEEGQGEIQMSTRLLRPPEIGPAAGPSATATGPSAGSLAGSPMPPAGPPAGVLMPPAAEVEISVEDNGCGIPEELLAEIYDPFFTTKKDGTGLGLALVQRAVLEHGGRIRCASLVGKGTTFRLAIPCAPPLVMELPPTE